MNIGRIKKVPLRELWKREDTDFSAWLETEIDVLNDILDISITIEKREENVGPFRVDLYGEDNLNRKVIIENQLEKSDHDHLGKVLTYMTNLEAGVAIWINKEPREEHVKAIEWLNEVTPEDVAFYLIKLEAIKIGSEDVAAPLFTIVNGPSITAKQIGAERKEFAEGQMIRYRFWQKFLEYANTKSDLFKNNSPSKDQWIYLSTGTSGISVTPIVTGRKGARVELFISKGDKELNKNIFDQFHDKREALEAAFGDKLEWDKAESGVTSRVKYGADSNDYSVNNEEQWSDMIKFLYDASERMYKAFKGPISKLKVK